MSAFFTSSLRWHSLINKKCQHVTQNLLRNQRCTYYLSTNHRLFANNCNVSSNESERNVIEKVSKLGNVSTLGHVAPIYLACQVQRRTFSTHQIDPFSTTKPQGFWQMIADNPFVDASQDFLIWLHVNTNLPWWGTIILSATLLRNFVTLPITIYTGKLKERAAKIHKKLLEGADDLQLDVRLEASRRGWKEKQAEKVYNFKMNQIYKEKCVDENCHPFKIVLLPLMQIPPWLVLSISIRKFCAMLPDSKPTWIEVYQQMSSEGFLWINNLASVDPYFVLPFSLFVVNLALTELTQGVSTNTLQKVMHNCFRGLSVLSGLVACIIPTGVVLFWISTSSLAVVHHFVTKRVLKKDPNMSSAKLLFPGIKAKKPTDVNSRLELLRKIKLKQK